MRVLVTVWTLCRRPAVRMIGPVIEVVEQRSPVEAEEPAGRGKAAARATHTRHLAKSYARSPRRG
jgi:hypothetical protein